MPNLANHQSNEFTKTLLLGDSKSRKTSSLVSLVEAGYWLGILDFDNLLDPLKNLVMEKCPDKADNVEFRTLRDKHKASVLGPVIDGAPKAFIDALKMLDNWKYKTASGEEIDYGKPSEWGPDRILVLDSLSRLCDAAYDWAEPIVPRNPRTGEFDGRAVYGTAQDAVESILGMLTSAGFQTNVIVICHGIYMDQPDGQTKIFPQGVGQKLSPKIPQYFPVYIRYRNKGGKYTIQTKSDVTIDLANSKPFAIEESYPVETGLASIFEVLRAQPAKVTPLKRKA
jgi:hypothetical protein